MSAAGSNVVSYRDKQKAKLKAKSKGKTADGEASYTDAGPERLSKTPARVMGGNDGKLDPSWQQLWQHLQARITMGMAWRNSWAQHWALLEGYILPRRGIMINVSMPTTNTMIRGLPINENIIDPTGTQAMRICASGLMSGLMSPGRPWFKLKPALTSRDEADPDALEWFEEVEDRMYHVMGHSNFYDAGAQMFEDLCVFGTGPMIIYEDAEEIIRCYVPCPGEYFCFPDNANRVGAMGRLFVQTVNQIVGMFGIDNCPPDIRELWNTKGASLEIERLVAHMIEPNFPVQRGAGDGIGVVKGDFTWREAYWLWGTASNKPLSLAGFKDAPYIAPRWATTSNDAYGRSPGMDVLPDIMQLQQETMRKAEAIEKQVRPPMLASIELKNEPSSILPGHVTYVSGLGPDKGMRPTYEVQPEIREMMEDLKEIQARIKTGWFNDLFLMMAESTKDMTAYEVAQRQQEKLQVLGPVVERFQNEAAGPAIKRIYRIMARKNLLPPLPKSLQGVTLGLEFVSIMSLAQKASSTSAMERFAQMCVQTAQSYPQAKAMLKPTEFLTEYADNLSVPKRMVGSAKDVAALESQIAQNAQQQQALAAAKNASSTARDLSQTDVGGGANALSALLSPGQASGGAPAQ